MTKDTVNLKSLTPLLAELERAARWVPDATGMDYLEHPIVFTIQTNGRRPSVLGHFASERWADKDGNKVHEISIAAEHLHREPIEVIETVIHELVHAWNEELGVQDTSRGNLYHNKQFKEAAESVGLVVVKMATHGWAGTSLSDSLRAKIEDGLVIDEKVFELARQALPKAPKKPPTKQYTYRCQPCGYSVRSKKAGLSITCDDCGEKLEIKS